MPSTSVTPTWSSVGGAIRVICHPPHLRKTLLVTLVVGTLLFAINHLDVVVRGEATPAVWVKGAVTYLVPFGVANIGVLIATRRRV